MSTVSIPPSVRNTPPSSCGSRSRSTSRTYHLRQAPFQERPVADVHLQRECIAIRGGGLLVPFQAPEEVGPCCVEKVVAGQIDLLDGREPQFRAVRHRDRDGPVELYDRRRLGPRQLVVEGSDLRPVG